MRSNDKDDARLAFAERFLNALKLLGYSYNEQKKMERLFGVSGQAVRKWAEGQSMPTASRMPYVAKVLGVRRAWLQDGEEPIYPLLAKLPEEEKEAFSTNTDQEFFISTEEANFLNMYRKLAPKQKTVVSQMLGVLLEKTS